MTNEDEQAETPEVESTEDSKGEEKVAAAPRASKKKAKKKAAAVEPSDDSPEGLTLKEAEVAFEIGDYRKVRELAGKLQSSSRAPVADRARDLLRRTDVDPAQMIFLAVCACVLIGIAFYYLR